MSIIGSIIYGIVSGLTEILPVSSQANQMVMRQIFGVSHKEPIRDLLVHIAILAALLLACRGMFSSGNHCLERLACHYADMENGRLRPLERDVAAL